MSTILNTNGEKLQVPRPLKLNYSFDIVVADWNPAITHALRDGALEVLKEAGVAESMTRVWNVPGTVELVNAAAAIVRRGNTSGVIVIGCVIRGDTPHFDYVCMHTAQGVATLNAEGKTPVTFGVLTVDNLRQAQQRAGGELGNKGAEAACVAIEMANLHTRLLSI